MIPTRIRWNRKGLNHRDDIPSYDGLFRRNGTVQSAYFCPCCGSEIFGEWKYTLFFNFNKCKALLIQKLVADSVPEYRSLQDEAEEFSQLTRCPVCGGELKHCDGFFIQNDMNTDDVQFFKNTLCRNALRSKKPDTVMLETLEDVFQHLHRQRDLSDRQEARQEADALLSKFKAEKASAVAESGEIALNQEAMKEYFLQVIRLETGILSLMQRLPELYYYKTQVSRLAQQQRAGCFRHLMEPLDEKCRCITAAQKALFELKREPLPESQLTEPEAPLSPNLKLPAFPHWFKIRSENKRLTQEYEQAREQYEKDHAEYLILSKTEAEEIRLTRQTELKNAETRLQNLKWDYDHGFAGAQSQMAQWDSSGSPEFATLHSLTFEIRSVENTLRDQLKILQGLYHQGVIYPKYHNLSAVSAFYEYLITGRCANLKGADGCYNLYEEECRTGIIPTEAPRIDDVSEKLKVSQYVLWEQLNRESGVLGNLSQLLQDACRTSDFQSSDLYYGAAAEYYRRLHGDVAAGAAYLDRIKWRD